MEKKIQLYSILISKKTKNIRETKIIKVKVKVKIVTIQSNGQVEKFP